MRSWLLALLVAVLPALAFAQEPPRAAMKYRADLVRSARLVWGLDAPVAVMAAQVHQESGWRPDARSAYAHGLAQFTPDTAEWIAGQDAALAGADTGNPVWALRALARYDKWLHDRVTPAGNVACDRWWGALRGYNGGLGHWLKEVHPLRIEARSMRSAAGHPVMSRTVGKTSPIPVRFSPNGSHSTRAGGRE